MATHTYTQNNHSKLNFLIKDVHFPRNNSEMGNQTLVEISLNNPKLDETHHHVDSFVLMKISFSPEMEQLLSNGYSLVTNGTRKVISADQKTKTVTFFNGDIKHILEDGKVVSSVVTFLTFMYSMFESLISGL